MNKFQLIALHKHSFFRLHMKIQAWNLARAAERQKIWNKENFANHTDKLKSEAYLAPKATEKLFLEDENKGKARAGDS